MDVYEKIREAKTKKEQGLDLGSYGLKKLPKELFELIDLRVLYLDGNSLTELPPEIKLLANLTQLKLSRNALTRLPKEISSLSNLSIIHLNGNKLCEFPEEILQLTNLSFLDLSDNRFTTLPDKITRLKNLNFLDLSNTGIKNVPKNISRLTYLSKLYLNNNKLTTIPKEIIRLPNLTILDLKNNPLAAPPIEIANQGIKEIRNYFESLEESGTQKLYEAKQIIIGEGGVGKTCLMKVLVDCDYKINRTEPTTEGIEIENWFWEWGEPNNSIEFKVNIWDFGGQEIYHATHQFFLTKRSLYILVWDARREDDYFSFSYWLNTVSLLSNNSPLIIVLNKIDERVKEIDQASLKDRFDNIVDFCKVSCLDGRGIMELSQKIKETIVTLPHVGNEWPNTWTKIRREIEKDTRDYIDYPEYLNLCKQFGLNEEKAIYLSSYLHDLGIILHFQDDKILKNTVILKPEWGTNAVYKILDTKKIVENKGRFTFDDLKLIWDNCKYPSNKHLELLQLMIKFELCFPLLDSNEYIIPELLSPVKPLLNWNNEKNLKFEYHYEFMPAGIITRFITRNHLNIEGNLYWRNGVVLTYNEARALVISDAISKKIKISTCGKNGVALFNIIEREFDYIHRTLNNPKVKEMIPCICSICRGNENNFFNYKDLKNFRLRKITSIPCNVSYEHVSVEELLNGFEIENISNLPKDVCSKDTDTPPINVNIKLENSNTTNNDSHTPEKHQTSWFQKHSVATGIITSVVGGILLWLLSWDKIRSLVKSILEYFIP